MTDTDQPIRRADFLEPDGIHVCRCTDTELIAQILKRDYADEPVRSFPRTVVATLARTWCSHKVEVCVLVVEVAGVYAGFLFGHCLGPRIWRRFAQEHPLLLPALARVWIGQRFKHILRRRSRPSGEGNPPAPVEGLPESGRPFSWGSVEAKSGIVEFLYVRPEYRGRGLAEQLLSQFFREMSQIGVGFTEAHIAPHNRASVRAFQKAGWQVHQTTSGDLWAFGPER
jgi:GNAT superfamily N-acetyltransferase